MPGSFPCFDPLTLALVQWLAPPRVLDIGAGAGKYGRMLAHACPGTHATALESEAAYVREFGLDQIYGEVVTDDAWAWAQRVTDVRFDLVIAGDCLEHLPKSQGLDLLNALTYRSAWLLVVAPEFVVQGATGGVASEIHRSVWSERDFHWHDRWAWDNCRTLNWVLLRGYLPSPRSLEDTVRHLNQAQLPVLDFDGSTPVRPAWLRMVEHPRDVSYRVA